MANSYLAGIPAKRKGTVYAKIVPWVVMIVVFFSVWELLSPERQPGGSKRRTHHEQAAEDDSHHGRAIALFGIFGVGVLVVSMVVVATRKAHKHNVIVRDAEARLLIDDVDGAVDVARLALKTVEALPRYNAFMILGQCAERRGDFAEAADLYDQAPTSLPTTNPLHARVLPFAAARRAFALAAADRLDEAEQILGRAPLPDSLPGTYAYSVRARVVVDSKRARYKQLLDGLAAARVALRETLPPRELALLRAVAAHARTSVSDAGRAAAAVLPVRDPELKEWIALVVPRVSTVLEGAS